MTPGLLHTALDWQLHGDLGRQLKYPELIARTSLGPDMIVTSEASKHMITLQLAGPWEERTEEANERKRTNQELVEVCRDRSLEDLL